MTLLAPLASIALDIGYVLVALLLIGALCAAVVRLVGGQVGTRPHKRGRVGATEETVDPGDGTPHAQPRSAEAAGESSGPGTVAR
jgi:hypothetical protein